MAVTFSNVNNILKILSPLERKLNFQQTPYNISRLILKVLPHYLVNLRIKISLDFIQKLNIDFPAI